MSRSSTALRRLMSEYRSPFVPELPRFTGGAVGFLGYDAAPWFEPALAPTWAALRRAVDGDDAGFMLFDTVLAFDHVKHRILIIANARITPDEDLEALYQFACARIRVPRARAGAHPVAACGGPRRSRRRCRSHHASATASSRRSARRRSTSRPATSTRSCSRSGSRPTSRAPPFTVYRALRHVNPSPYMYFIRFGRTVDRRVVAGDAGAGGGPPRRDAPDCRHAPARRQRRGGPAARRGAEARREGARRARDARRPRPQRRRARLRLRHRAGAAVHGARALLARHAPGLEGRGPPARGPRPARRARVLLSRPGTVSGAPKIRAMEIIAELEPGPRGLYAGAVGYLDFAGQPRLLHRDPHHRHRRAGTASVQAGAGIVADSNPAAEYQESCDKARGAAERHRAGRSGPAVAPWCSLIDNYDSFTFNLAQYLGELGADVQCPSQRRVDASTRSRRCGPSHIVISPGPGRPEEAGISVDVDSREFGPHVPLLGVCLGHQAIGLAFGGDVVRAPRPMHGKTSTVEHDGRGVFAGIDGAVRRGALPLAGRGADDALPADARGVGARSRGRRPSWGCATATGPCTACSSIPSR